MKPLPDLDFCPACGQRIRWVCTACGRENCNCSRYADRFAAGGGVVTVPLMQEEVPVCGCTDREVEL